MKTIRGYMNHKHMVEKTIADCRQSSSKKMVNVAGHGTTWEVSTQHNCLLYADIYCAASVATIAEIISAVPLMKSWHPHLVRYDVITHSESLMYSQATAVISVKNRLDFNEMFATDAFEV
jgi:CRAL/TRIO domain